MIKNFGKIFLGDNAPEWLGIAAFVLCVIVLLLIVILPALTLDVGSVYQQF